MSIVEMTESGESLFWMTWCGKSSDCECYPTMPVGVDKDREKSLESWRFQHFIKRYQGKFRR